MPESSRASYVFWLTTLIYVLVYRHTTGAIAARKRSVDPGNVRQLPDGRWTFTLIIDGEEKQAIVCALPSADAARVKMAAMVDEKRKILRQTFG
jgi:hypothetical protein